MTKDDLVAALAEEAGQPKPVVLKMIEAWITVTTRAVAEGKEVRLPAWGVITQVKRPARKGRNPRTGETIEVAASVTAKFTPGSKFKVALPDS